MKIQKALPGGAGIISSSSSSSNTSCVPLTEFVADGFRIGKGGGGG